MKNGTAFGLGAGSLIAFLTCFFLETGLHTPLTLFGCVAFGAATVFFAVKYFKTR